MTNEQRELFRAMFRAQGVRTIRGNRFTDNDFAMGWLGRCADRGMDVVAEFWEVYQGCEEDMRKHFQYGA